jgi:parallel beta-helix repeat protein
VIGNGTVAIAIRGVGQADGITIRGNSFADIGADGIQMADGGRLVANVLVEGNRFTAPTLFAGGENAIDVKGVDGPVIIRANQISGFRPCDKATMQCTGSTGVGIVVHEGSASGRAANVTIVGNTFTDNTIGLNVTYADSTTIVDNTFVDNVTAHVRVSSAAVGCTRSGNTFVGPAIVDWGPCL